jgi:site-specific recombinase XerD
LSRPRSTSTKHPSPVPVAIRGVYERVPGSGIWWIRWTDSNGKLHREKVGRRSDAIALVQKRRTETLQKKKLPEQFRPKVRFNSLCDDAIEHSRATNDAKVTHDLELKVAKLRLAFGELDAFNITKQDIVRWLTAEAEKREWSAATRNRWQAAFSLIFRVGIDNERIDRNPASHIRRQTENNARIRFLSEKEEAELRKVMLRRCPAQIPTLDLSLHTGMRTKEQFSLKWEQVDFERRILTLPKTKNGTMRHIPLNSIAIAALTTISAGQIEGTEIFPSKRKEGAALLNAKGWFNAAIKEAKIERYTWHCNRHTFASRLVMRGINLRTIGELLGHRTMAMTMRYSHLSPAHNAAAVDSLVSVSVMRTGTTTDTSEKAVAKLKTEVA